MNNMGKSESKRIFDSNGNYLRTERKIQKPLNAYMEGALKATLKRDDISINMTRSASDNELQVLDSNGNVLFIYLSAWDYGYYSITAPNSQDATHPHIIAEMDWRENDMYTSPEQQKIFDIFDLMKQRMKELQAKKDLSQEDQLLAQFLYKQANNEK